MQRDVPANVKWLPGVVSKPAVPAIVSSSNTGAFNGDSRVIDWVSILSLVISVLAEPVADEQSLVSGWRELFPIILTPMRMFWPELVDFRPLNYGEDMLTGGKYLFHTQLLAKELLVGVGPLGYNSQVLYVGILPKQIRKQLL